MQFDQRMMSLEADARKVRLQIESWCKDRAKELDKIEKDRAAAEKKKAAAAAKRWASMEASAKEYWTVFSGAVADLFYRAQCHPA